MINPDPDNGPAQSNNSPDDESPNMENGSQCWDDRPGVDHISADGAFVVDVEGFEGPLDVLLALARTQKVDIASISVVALVDQYLEFINEAKRLRLELAADYLVMAAWLAFLKSRLLLPTEGDNDEEVTAEEMAQRLAFRLKRLEAMRDVAAQLMARNRLGHDVFPRGMPDGFKKIRDVQHTAKIHDLLTAYARQRQRTVNTVHKVEARKVWSIQEARLQLQKLIGDKTGAWVQLDQFLDKFLPQQDETRTARASSFGASLEMAREGIVELRQDAPFAPLYMRVRVNGEDNAEWKRVG